MSQCLIARRRLANRANARESEIRESQVSLGVRMSAVPGNDLLYPGGDRADPPRRRRSARRSRA